MFRYVRLAILVLLSIAIGSAFAVALVPFVHTKWWLVRLLDFPRLQFGIVTIVLLTLLAFFWRRYPVTVSGLAIAAVVAIGADAAVLWPYRDIDTNGEQRASCPADHLLKVMISNVLLSNRQSETLLDEVRAQKPDVFLAMEIDDWWDKTLQPLATDMPNGATKITGSYYGIRLFSRLPLVDPEVRFLAGRDTPAVVTGVTLRNGETITFLGMHPRPPLVGQSALPRDAELYAAGKLLRDRSDPSILAGDLNSTPWEDAVERMRRIAGLVDPRRDYGYVYSFDALSHWAKWPLDQIFYKPGFDVVSLERLAPIGSDHYPYVVSLCRDPAAKAPTPEPEDEDDREAVGEANAAASKSASP